MPLPPLNQPPSGPKKPFNWGRFSKTLSFWALIILIPVAFFRLAQGRDQQAPTISYSLYDQQLGRDNIKKVTIASGQQVVGEFRAPVTVEGRQTPTSKFTTMLPMENSQGDLDRLRAKNVQIESVEPRAPIASYLVNWLPMLLIIAFWLFLFKQMQAGGAKAFSFGKSKAKLLSGDTPKVTFADVAGADEAKVELQEIIEFLKDPQKFTRLGGRLPKGALLVGPPGTGKTLLAKAVAGEAGRPFFSMSGSDFVEMFVGVGASRVRDLFEQGKAHAPCIIFIDEIDAVGRHRGAGLGGGHDEREQTLNQLLVEMDGFESNDGVILIAATNRPDVLDPALLRPGRFDRQIVVDAPDLKGREGILKVHLRKVPVADDVQVTTLARGTPGMSGADLANLVNEGALLAARRNHDKVYMTDLEEAKDKVMLGAERKSMVMKEEERRLTAFHEAGHAVCAIMVPGNDPLHKVTIVPRGRALGLAFTLPEDDRVSVTRQQIEARLVMAYGGRTAEEIVFGRDRVTTGAASDIQQATGIARRYVSQWGLSDAIGPILVGDNEQELFLGRELQHRREVSEKTAQLVDAEVTRVIKEAFDRAKATLTANRPLLDAVAAALLERETLTREDIGILMRGEKLPPRTPASPPAVPTPLAPAPVAEPRRSTLALDRVMASTLAPTWAVRGRMVSLDRPFIFGIVNVTPDSFSDGGRFFSADAAVAHAERLVEEGADGLDVGGESTRPQGARPVEADEERERVLPVLAALRRRFPGTVLSIDTVKADVARSALDAGADVVNDVSGFRLDPRMGEICAREGCGVILMHSRGGVSEMGTYLHASYEGDVTDVVMRELGASVKAGRDAGVADAAIVLDPGVGFAKRSAHSLEVLHELPRLAALGFPLLVGASRKRFIGELTGVKEPAERVNGTVGAHVAALMRGARLFRVHDVRPHRQALDVAHAVLAADPERQA